MAKSRLTPLKAMTIPRMELSAAVLATRLDNIIKQELDLPLDGSTFWTDSSCVLRYIKNKDKRFQTFVANRISAILDQSTAMQWRYVETSLNPADEAFRGVTLDALLNNQRWTHGPAFLRELEDKWPQRPNDIGEISSNDPELKKNAETFTSHASKQFNHINKAIQKFSSWTRLKKIIALVLRYKNNLRKQVRRHQVTEIDRNYAYADIKVVPPISVSELKESEKEILKFVQKQSFQEELVVLRQRSKTFNKSSHIYKLDPILEDGLIRVGGRLQQAPISDNAKHPIILPKKNRVSKLIVNYYHRASGHSGVEYTLSFIQQKFWIIGARSSVRDVTKTCFDCRKRQAPALQQKMASLPENRVTPSKPPFTSVGVDCFGNFTVCRGRTTAKRYGVLFTCLAVRAVHIEIIHSMDTESFINALRRFIARRGKPEEIRSDNGGNFVKGEKELRKAVEQWNQEQIHEFLLQRDIIWSFNPPAASHYGGVWERCIRSVRKVMKALLKQQCQNESRVGPCKWYEHVNFKFGLFLPQILSSCCLEENNHG